MFEELYFQIKHQYGKYLNFENAYTKNKEWISAKNNGFYEDETIVRFIPKCGGYQIKHIYGKYLNFNNAYTNSKESISGMNTGFFEDETIVHIISKCGGYQIKHQYGKYLNFDNAYTKSNDWVYGMSKGFFVDETIVHLIPIKYSFSIEIVNFTYDEEAVTNVRNSGRPVRAIFKTFENKTNNTQSFDINEEVTYTTSTTFEYSSEEVTEWLHEVSADFNISTKVKCFDILPFSYKFSWNNTNIKKFQQGTTVSRTETIRVNDHIKVRPHSKMNYKYMKNVVSDLSIPYEATMKIRCSVDGDFVSKEALKYVLDYIGDCPNGEMHVENGHGVYYINLQGKIIPDGVLSFHTKCSELDL